MTAARKKPQSSLLPEHIRRKLEAPDRPRNDKVTARFTGDEYKLLARIARERGESVSSLVRKLVLATIDDVGGRLHRS